MKDKSEVDRAKINPAGHNWDQDEEPVSIPFDNHQNDIAKCKTVLVPPVDISSY